jgi:hypothetical protein
MCNTTADKQYMKPTVQSRFTKNDRKNLHEITIRIPDKSQYTSFPTKPLNSVALKQLLRISPLLNPNLFLRHVFIWTERVPQHEKYCKQAPPP